MTTMSTARDEIAQLVLEGWSGAWYRGSPVQMRWTGAERPDLPPTDLPWARTTITHNTSTQRTLGEPGRRRFERSGIVQIQIFTPLSDSLRLSLSESYSTLARDSLEGRATASGVWFREVGVADIGVDQDSGAWWQTNVSALFTYDDVK